MPEETSRTAVLNEVLQIISYAREAGERDLRQIRNWVEALRKQSADELLAELKSE